MEQSCFFSDIQQAANSQVQVPPSITMPGSTGIVPHAFPVILLLICLDYPLIPIPLAHPSAGVQCRNLRNVYSRACVCLTRHVCDCVCVQQTAACAILSLHFPCGSGLRCKAQAQERRSCLRVVVDRVGVGEDAVLCNDEPAAGGRALPLPLPRQGKVWLGVGAEHLPQQTQPNWINAEQIYERGQYKDSWTFHTRTSIGTTRAWHQKRSLGIPPMGQYKNYNRKRPPAAPMTRGQSRTA